MRFKASIRNIHTFTRLTASLNSLGREVWLQLDNDQLRFTVVPEQGSQVWAVLAIESIFEDYTIQSASPNNVINLRVPLSLLHRALRSATSASSASIRLTKKDNIPLLSLTITTNTFASTFRPTANIALATSGPNASTNAPERFSGVDAPIQPNRPHHSDRDTTITQSVPIQVLPPAEVAHIHEPICPEPDVHILLPPTAFAQLKQISERFTKLTQLSSNSSKAPIINTRTSNDNETYDFSAPLNTRTIPSASSSSSRLILSANASGTFAIRAETPTLKISSRWTGLVNPELDPSQVQGGEAGVAAHASTLAKQRAARGEDTWAEVRVEGRDWGRVLSVGRLGGRVVACFCNNHALILYVYLQSQTAFGESAGDTIGGEGDRESVLTYYIASYSA